MKKTVKSKAIQKTRQRAISKAGLNLNQKKFCRNYVSREFFGNGMESYIEAYDIIIKRKSDYLSAMASASRLLRNVKVCEHLNGLLEAAGLNDQFVDKQLLFLITQHDDLKTKIAAIKEYNELKARIQKNLPPTQNIFLTYEQYLTVNTSRGHSETLGAFPNLQRELHGLPSVLSKNQKQEVRNGMVQAERGPAYVGGEDSGAEEEWEGG
jgi:hypothetical protein